MAKLKEVVSYRAYAGGYVSGETPLKATDKERLVLSAIDISSMLVKDVITDKIGLLVMGSEFDDVLTREDAITLMIHLAQYLDIKLGEL